MSEMKHVTWTGGTEPGEWAKTTQVERDYVYKLFHKDCRIWEDYWKTNIIPPNTRDVFWKRARYDAHATFRQHHRKHQL